MNAADYQAQYGRKSAGSRPPRAPSAPPATMPPPEPNEAATVVKIVFHGKVPSLNGEGGLLRMHWSKRRKVREDYEWVVAAARLPQLAGPVRLELVRFGIGTLDYDNLVGSGKLLLDALVRCGVLPDDSPAVITERDYRQQPAEGRGYQRTEITLTPL